MSRSLRGVRVVAVAVTCAGIAGVALLPAISPAGGSAPSSEPAPPSEPSPTSEPTTTGIPAFADGEDARLAAEELIGVYLESEIGVTVSDAACSVPETGAVGDEFVCYALKPEDLIVAVRATVGPQRLIELTPLFDQPPPTTAPPEPTTTS